MPVLGLNLTSLLTNARSAISDPELDPLPNLEDDDTNGHENIREK